MPSHSPINLIRGTGNPEGTVIAELGTLYARQNTTTLATVYQKTRQTVAGTLDSTGWTLVVAQGANVPSSFSPIVKSTLQDVTNSVALVAATEITFPAVQDGLYAVEMGVYCSGSDATGDFAFRLGVSAGTMSGRGQALSVTTADAIQTSLLLATGAVTTATISVGTAADVTVPGSIRIFYAFRQIGADANFQFQFANVAAAVGRVSRVNAGSWITWSRIA
jgi:hypothetical protein